MRIVKVAVLMAVALGLYVSCAERKHKHSARTDTEPPKVNVSVVADGDDYVDIKVTPKVVPPNAPVSQSADVSQSDMVVRVDTTVKTYELCERYRSSRYQYRQCVLVVYRQFICGC